MSFARNMLKSLSSVQGNIGIRSMCSKNRNYKDAIAALNSLQTNAISLSKSIHLKQHQKHDEANYNLRDTEKFLERIDDGFLSALEKLSFIHVSGSKGKGSVCTYTDAMLREHNVKTGLFTSPHLMSVTERIKILGSPVSESEFTKYFWEIYDVLQKKKSHESDLPSYFKFLQIMAFYIFIKENVEVAIIEVGIGGQYDSTNILRNTELVGITALQLEHTQLLGNTLEEIAWQKTGIIKENSDVYFMSQPLPCLKIIQERSKELKAKSISQSPDISHYQFINSKPNFVTSEINEKNFSLAAQLASKWLRNRKMIPETLFNENFLTTIEDKFVTAYNQCTFDGRFQKIEFDKKTKFYLDGAHTIDSMQICSAWFSKEISKDAINILIFNVTGDRDSNRIMASLHSNIHFDYVCFTTNILNHESYTERSENFTGILSTVQFDRCLQHKDIWIKSLGSKHVKQSIMCHSTIQNALDFIESIKENNDSLHINVLVTGSLHLVGGVLKLIKPALKKENPRKIKSTDDEIQSIKRLRTA